MAAIILKHGREKSVLRRHPWIFSGAVSHLQGEPAIGETVDVLDSKERFLARGAYSPLSQIRVRIWTWNENEIIDADFFSGRIKAALDLRKGFIEDTRTNALRLVHGESDGLSGIVVDRYGDTLILQCLSAGADHWRDTLVEILSERTSCKCVYERSDVDVRELEGLPQRSGVLLGDLAGEIEIWENGLQFSVDVSTGQKTGFYLDQRKNRQRVGELVKGMDVLNCFSYTGAFSVYALAGGANRVLSVDSSAQAIAASEKNLTLNHLQSAEHETLEGDVFKVLRDLRDRNRKFDAIILDPPKFAPTTAQAEKAARGYKDINLLAIKLLRPGGLLFTFSCSGGVSADLFQKIVAGAALDAGDNVLIMEHLFQDADHPVALNFPEGTYLKGLICRKSV